jgi:two-component system NtrC family sensor kinase
MLPRLLSGFNLRIKLFLTFLLILALVGTSTAVVGILYIEKLVVAEGQKRIGTYLKVAWSVYNTEMAAIGQTVRLVAHNPLIAGGLGEQQGEPAGNRKSEEASPISAALEDFRVAWKLDFLTLTDLSGRVVARGRFPYNVNDYLKPCCSTRSNDKTEYCAYTSVLSAERLELEGKGLPEKALTQFEPTAHAKERPGKVETSGMTMKACALVTGSDGQPLGWLYGGVLLNGNYAMVDHIRQMVFGDERFHGKEIGTVTLFHWDLRIATNVRTSAGERAVGTRVSSEVYDAVLEGGQSWLDEAFVVNDWYLSAYEPIRNQDGETIGMLYVGELVARYEAMRRDMLLGFLAASAVGILLVAGLALFVSRYLARPLVRLTEVARRVAAGDYKVTVPVVKSRDEIGELTHTFDKMVHELDDRGARLAEALERQKGMTDELQKTNRDYLDILGFVSHEMRSPLAASVMALGSMETGCAERMTDMERMILSKIKKNVQHVVDISSNYLNLSRIERKELAYHPANVALASQVLEPVVSNFTTELAARKMQLVQSVPADCIVHGDTNLLSVIYTNLVSNAIKYGREGGRIQLGAARDGDFWRLNVYNEGVGITAEERERLFRRFSRLDRSMLKDARGTGLGLFISRSAVQLHGGRIWVEGEKDAYANFVFTIPAASLQA